MNRFDKAAKEWDTKPTSQQVAKSTSQTIREFISLDNKEILDYGCGTGLLAFNLLDKAKLVVGMDSSLGMVEVFNQKANDFGFENIKAVQHNIETQELPLKAFDVIVTSMTLHHILNPDIFIKKCKKALKPNGYFCISDLDKEDGTFHAKHKNDGVNHFGFSKDEIKQFYTKNGFNLLFLDDICTLERENGDFPIFLSIGQLQ